MLILTSSSYFVTQDWVRHLPKAPSQLRATFIATAAESENREPSWLKKDRDSLIAADFPVSDFTFTNKTAEEVAQMLQSSDVIFLSGGNTFYLLQQMKKSGFDRLVQDFLAKGGIYVGSSAGSVVTCPDITMIAELDDVKLAPELDTFKALNLADVTIFPHWGHPHFKDSYLKLITMHYAKGSKIILLTDDQYLLVNNTSFQIHSI